MGFIDLHMHSNASDGNHTPEELIKIAKEKRAKYISLTDHDTISNLEEFNQIALREDINVTNGVEIETQIDTLLKNSGKQYRRVHILGYGFKDKKRMAEELAFVKRLKDDSINRLLDKVKASGLYASISDIERHIGHKFINDSSIMRFLYEQGVTKAQIFEYFNYKNITYCLSVEEAINLIRSCGGVPIMAHPGKTIARYGSGLEENIITKLKDIGLVGIEAMHSSHTNEQMIRYKKIAQKKGMIYTVGSDYHRESNVEVVSGLDDNLNVSDIEIMANLNNEIRKIQKAREGEIIHA